MLYELKVKIGKKEFLIRDEASSQKDLMTKLAFWTSLPEAGPSGNDNLKVSHRTPKGYEYISIVDEEAGQELTLGFYKEREGELFVKDWKPVYGADSAEGLGSDYEEESSGLGSQVEEQEEEVPAPPKPSKKNAKPASKTSPAPSVDNGAMASVLSKYGLGSN